LSRHQRVEKTGRQSQMVSQNRHILHL
jgi:hypothetical protein